MDDRSRRVQERFEWPMVIAALLVIPVVWIDSVNASHTVKTVGTVLNWLTWGAFLVEAVVMLYVSRIPTQWLKSHPLDAAVVVLSPPFIPNSFVAIRLLRLLRLLRLGRLLSLAKLLSLRGLRYAAFLVLFVVLIGGAAFATVETNQHLSTWDGVWWAITTVTTVGSNISPETTGGRVIAIVVMLSGIGFVAYMTAFVAERFVRQDTERIDRHEERMLAELRDIRERIERLEG